jgi:hypothetical protein
VRRYLLVDAVREDAFLAFGTVPDEVLIGWPERWTLVRRIGVLAVNRPPLYWAAWEPPESGDRWRPGWPGAAPGAPAVYEAFGLFMAVPMPVLAVSLGSGGEAFVGRVAGVVSTNVALHRVGSAQVWRSGRDAMVWECYMNEVGRREVPAWRDVLAAAWAALRERAAAFGVGRIWTPAWEPAWPDGGDDYRAFLEGLGFRPSEAGRFYVWEADSCGP